MCNYAHPPVFEAYQHFLFWECSTLFLLEMWVSGLSCFSLQSACVCTAEKAPQGVDMHVGVPTCHTWYRQSPRKMDTSQGFWPWRTGSAVRQRHIATFSTNSPKDVVFLIDYCCQKYEYSLMFFKFFLKLLVFFNSNTKRLASQYLHGHHKFDMEHLMFMDKRGCSLFMIVVTTSLRVQVKKLMVKTQLCINALC